MIHIVQSYDHIRSSNLVGVSIISVDEDLLCSTGDLACSANLSILEPALENVIALIMLSWWS